ncbi:hypothetical protein DFH09DRAFT_1101479 [Mycena vulgaris]|nr:hypothetical protein DFH09DRAFT_1101479 [Mycena vulgaris]
MQKYTGDSELQGPQNGQKGAKMRENSRKQPKLPQNYKVIENILNYNLADLTCARKNPSSSLKIRISSLFCISPRVMAHQYILISLLVQNGREAPSPQSYTLVDQKMMSQCGDMSQKPIGHFFCSWPARAILFCQSGICLRGRSLPPFFELHDSEFAQEPLEPLDGLLAVRNRMAPHSVIRHRWLCGAIRRHFLRVEPPICALQNGHQMAPVAPAQTLIKSSCLSPGTPYSTAVSEKNSLSITLGNLDYEDGGTRYCLAKDMASNGLVVQMTMVICRESWPKSVNMAPDMCQHLPINLPQRLSARHCTSGCLAGVGQLVFSVLGGACTVVTPDSVPLCYPGERRDHRELKNGSIMRSKREPPSSPIQSHFADIAQSTGIKSESASPHRPPRASALRANNLFSSDGQYGRFLDSQVGGNTYIDELYTSTGLPSRYESSPAPADNDTPEVVKSELPVITPALVSCDTANNAPTETAPQPEHCTKCIRLTDDQNHAFTEPDNLYDQWIAALRERDDLQEELLKAAAERDTMILERDGVILERDQWRRAVAQLVNVAGIYMPLNQ